MPDKILVAFDFDHTVVDGNTDVHVQTLSPGGAIPPEIKSLGSEQGWTKLMGAVFQHLHSNNVTKEQILKSMLDIDFTSGMKELLEYLKNDMYEVIIISDSNSVFIEEILEENGLKSVIDKVYTNPAKFQSNGLLTIEYYHEQNWCDLSTINLCKGHILETHAKEKADKGITFSRIIYVGDGKNDLCPSLKLSESDFTCPRKGYGLMKSLTKIMQEGGDGLKAQVLPWDTGSDILQLLKKLDS